MDGERPCKKEGKESPEEQRVGKGLIEKEQNADSHKLNSRIPGGWLNDKLPHIPPLKALMSFAGLLSFAEELCNFKIEV